MQLTTRHWLWDWMDENGISSVDAAERAMRRKNVLRDLRERAADWEPILGQALQGTSVIAGAGADLRSGLQCPRAACQKHSIDELFRRVWHYFDQIVLNDDITHDVAHHWNSATESEIRERFLTRLDVMLYLRQIGAENLVHFRQKLGAGTTWHRALRREGCVHVVEASQSVFTTLRKSAQVEVTVSDGITTVNLNAPELEFERGVAFPTRVVANLTISQLKLRALSYVWTGDMSDLAADIVHARSLRSALGCVHPPHRDVLTRSGELTPESVAFDLKFPVLDGVPISALMRMRSDEADLFSRLRVRLRQAIAERAANSRMHDSVQVADQIRMDLIEPELRKIKARLRASEKVLAKKSAVGLALGSLVTTCGMIAGAPMTTSLIGGIATVAAATQNAASKHLEEQRDVAMEDFYFVWKAASHAPGQDS
jgi:hypothetical protein